MPRPKHKREWDQRNYGPTGSMRAGRHGRITEFEKNRMKELRSKGLLNYQIADALGIHARTVCRYLRNNNVSN
jgi:IS30 family transposase